MLAVLMLNSMNMKRRGLRAKEVARKPETKFDPQSMYCRTCLSDENLVAIFSDPGMENKRSEELRVVTGLEIMLNDGLSQKMCQSCVDKMNNALKFRRQSRKAEMSLLNMSLGLKTKKKSITKNTRKTVKIKSPKVQKIKTKVEKVEDGYECSFDDFQNDCDYPEVPLTDFKEEEEKPKIKQLLKKPTRKRMNIPNAASYKCGTCNKEFRMKATYKAHMRFHTNYCVCETCGKRCRNNNQLQEHKRARHGLGRIHKCAYCEYSSATKEALTIHERRHTGERPYICDHCGASFHRRSNLVQHIAIHLPDKNFQCDMCPKRLKSRKFLQIHKHSAHTGKRYGYLCPVCAHRFEKPNRCDMCPKRLKSRKFLQIHKHNAHTGKRYGYLCPVCAHRFEKPNKCTVCLKREKSKKLLQVHVFKAHREKRYRYICPVCRDTFSRPGNVRQHLARSHGVPRAAQPPIPREQVHSHITEQTPPRIHTYL